ncbi:conserved hypothetical protein [Histoplasma capsulatum H143]|uniref:Uncharacterized protein n=1 Tax=Ajellomyces capsulatus (strain H143) TaxID=544712 RepID=C6HDW3_AJECH|nr:conserved hypothetical protein [Histoplasma capsulatum H143]
MFNSTTQTLKGASKRPVSFKRTSLPSIPEEISPLDHQILLHGGTTSHLERLPSRVQKAKHRSSSCYVEDQILDLTFENSYLRAELSLHEEYRHALMNLKSIVIYVSGMMEEMLSETTQQLNEADKNYLKLHGITEEKRESGLAHCRCEWCAEFITEVYRIMGNYLTWFSVILMGFSVTSPLSGLYKPALPPLQHPLSIIPIFHFFPHNSLGVLCPSLLPLATASVTWPGCAAAEIVLDMVTISTSLLPRCNFASLYRQVTLKSCKTEARYWDI